MTKYLPKPCETSFNTHVQNPFKSWCHNIFSTRPWFFLEGETVLLFPRTVGLTTWNVAEMSEKRLTWQGLSYPWHKVLGNEWACVCVSVYSMCDYMSAYVNNICLVLPVSMGDSRFSGSKGSFLSAKGNMTELKMGNQFKSHHHKCWPHLGKVFWQWRQYI